MPKKRYLNVDRGGYYQLQPDRTLLVNGTTVTEGAKFIRFKNHIYETADMGEQKLIEKLPDFENGRITIDQFKGDISPATPVVPAYTKGAATSVHMKGTKPPPAPQKQVAVEDED